MNVVGPITVRIRFVRPPLGRRLVAYFLAAVFGPDHAADYFVEHSRFVLEDESDAAA